MYLNFPNTWEVKMGFHPTPQKYLKRGKIMITAEESIDLSYTRKAQMGQRPIPQFLFDILQ